MRSVTRRKTCRRKSSDASCGSSRLNVGKMPDKLSTGHPRWSALPEGPLLRMFELMANEDDGRNRLREARLVCCTWRAAVQDVVLGDTATSRRCRPPLQATSDQVKPAATMNTCGAMMVGSNQSKDACNDEVEVCSKPPQQRGSSSGNMYTIAGDSEEAEQAGSVEQAPVPVPRHASKPMYVIRPSLPQRSRHDNSATSGHQTDAERLIQVTRRITRASAAAAALAAENALEEEEAGGTAAAQPQPQPQPATSHSGGPEPNGDAHEASGSLLVCHQERGSPAADASEEVQGALHSARADVAETGHNNATLQQTPDLHAMQQDTSEIMSQTAPGWKRLEARMEGVLPIWSIFKRFGRRPQTEL